MNAEQNKSKGCNDKIEREMSITIFIEREKRVLKIELVQ